MIKMIVIVAPSGTGKSTLIKRLKSDFHQLTESISCTTRPMRKGEIDGEHYFFLTRDVFEKMVKADDFLEWAEVHSNYYGTSKKFIRKMNEKKKIVLLDLDVQGADAIKKISHEEAQIIFIAPPSLDALEERLHKRALDAADVIAERLKNAAHELTRKNDYDYLVINDDLEKTYQELKNIFQQIFNMN